MCKVSSKKVKKRMATEYFEKFELPKSKVPCSQWFLDVFGAQMARNETCRDFEIDVPPPPPAWPKIRSGPKAPGRVGVGWQGSLPEGSLSEKVPFSAISFRWFSFGCFPSEGSFLSEGCFSSGCLPEGNLKTNLAPKTVQK